MTDLLETLHELVQNGLSWATLLSVVLFISKMRETRIRARERAEMRQDIKAIKQAVIKGESECAVTLNPTNACLTRRGVVGCLCSWAASFSARCVNKFMNYRRRKSKMEKLKSRKLWTAVITAVVVVLNNELNWGISEATIYSVVGLAISYILGQAHVDAKKATSENSQRPGDTGAAV